MVLDSIKDASGHVKYTPESVKDIPNPLKIDFRFCKKIQIIFNDVSDSVTDISDSFKYAQNCYML